MKLVTSNNHNLLSQPRTFVVMMEENVTTSSWYVVLAKKIENWDIWCTISKYFFDIVPLTKVFSLITHKACNVSAFGFNRILNKIRFAWRLGSIYKSKLNFFSKFIHAYLLVYLMPSFSNIASSIKIFWFYGFMKLWCWLYLMV